MRAEVERGGGPRFAFSLSVALVPAAEAKEQANLGSWNSATLGWEIVLWSGIPACWMGSHSLSSSRCKNALALDGNDWSPDKRNAVDLSGTLARFAPTKTKESLICCLYR